MLARLVLIACCLSVVPVALAGDLVTLDLNGEINWTTGEIQAVGFGAAPEGTPARKYKTLALRAAKIVALRNLLEIVEGVRVSSETTVLDLMLVSDRVHSRVSGIVRGAQVLNSSFDDSSGLATVTVKLMVTEGLYQALTEANEAQPRSTAENG